MTRFFLGLSMLSLLAPVADLQQAYTGNSVLDCNINDTTGPSSDILYTCNGLDLACLTFLVFTAQPPFNSVPVISALMSTDLDELATINNVSRLAVFPTNKEVIIPVNCSCAGPYYRANTTFLFATEDDRYKVFTLANSTFEGLTSCSALKQASSNDTVNEIGVPLRCACPTRNQSFSGVNYLLTYSVYWDDTIRDIGDRFNVTVESILEANGISDENPTIYPFTTILIPLKVKPLSSQMRIRSDGSGPAHSPSPPAPVPLSQKSNTKIFLGFGISVICTLVLFMVLFSVFWLYRKRQDEKLHLDIRYVERKRIMFSAADLRFEIASLEGVLRVFLFEELIEATGNFSPGNRIQGSVYRAMLGQEILAVKKKDADKVAEEVNIRNKINHFNLVKLRGFCHGDDGFFYLVSEYVSGGSLKEWLKNNRSSRKTKSWRQRVQIALDVADGLHYLHNFTEPGYVHGDVNSSNILLNADLRAKIGNFSLARAVSKRASTEEAGTMTTKTDVYAFGEVLLELITGKDPVSSKDGKEVLLFEQVLSVRGEKFQSLFDCRLGNAAKESRAKMVKLSLACLAPEPENRPGMEEIVKVLRRNQADLLRPKASTATGKKRSILVN